MKKLMNRSNYEEKICEILLLLNKNPDLVYWEVICIKKLTYIIIYSLRNELKSRVYWTLYILYLDKKDSSRICEDD